jgi:hypothetical protein
MSIVLQAPCKLRDIANVHLGLRAEWLSLPIIFYIINCLILIPQIYKNYLIKKQHFDIAF